MHWPLATPARRTVITLCLSRSSATIASLSALLVLPARRKAVMPDLHTGIGVKAKSARLRYLRDRWVKPARGFKAQPLFGHERGHQSRERLLGHHGRAGARRVSAPHHLREHREHLLYAPQG